MENITLCTFIGSEWQTYRSLRLRALEDAPDAFGTTFDESIGRPDEDWISRLRDLLPTTDLPLRADCDGRPCGLAWGRIEPGQPGTAYVFQMWVAPEFRGRGVGRMLLMKIIGWARSMNVDSVRLGVILGNTAAIALYESVGFKPIGEPELIRPNRALMVQDMQLRLQAISDYP